MPSPSVVTVGNAIVDIIAKADDAFIQDQGMEKSAMNLIDGDRAKSLYDAIGPAMEVSGGSAANTAVGNRQSWRRFRFYRQDFRRRHGENFPS